MELELEKYMCGLNENHHSLKIIRVLDIVSVFLLLATTIAEVVRMICLKNQVFTLVISVLLIVQWISLFICIPIRNKLLRLHHQNYAAVIDILIGLLWPIQLVCGIIIIVSDLYNEQAYNEYKTKESEAPLDYYISEVKTLVEKYTLNEISKMNYEFEVEKNKKKIREIKTRLEKNLQSLDEKSLEGLDENLDKEIKNIEFKLALCEMTLALEPVKDEEAPKEKKRKLLKI